MVAFFSPALPYVVPTTMIDAIKHLGLTSGLKLCLDAGDINSYSGTGQTWVDLSGGGYHFYRGTGPGVDSADPTFNGTAGGQSSSEYWSFDGLDWFTLNQSNPTWVNNLHKDGAVWSYATWIYLVDATTGPQTLAATADSTFDVGWYTAIVDSVGGGGYFAVVNGEGIILEERGPQNELSSSAWNFVAMSYTESTGAYVRRINDISTSVTLSGYANPSSAPATFTMQLASDTDAPDRDPFLSTSRMNSYLMWEGTALTEGQITALYNATKGKFGH